MLKHTLKLIWSDARRYIGLYIEQVIVFMILLICMVSTVDAIKRYNEPGLLNTENVIHFGYMSPNANPSETKKIDAKMEVIIERLKSSGVAKHISKSVHFTPYNRSDAYVFRDSVKVGAKTIRTAIKYADKDVIMVYEPQIIKGEWLDNKTTADGSLKAVVTNDLVREVGWSEAINQKIEYKGKMYSVVGVIERLKNSVFESPISSLIIPHAGNTLYGTDLSACVDNEDIFTLALIKEWQRADLDSTVQLMFINTDEMKQMSMLEVKMNLVMLGVPTIFLVFFAFIGTFGLFWLNSKKRVREFALRIAVGSTKRQLLGQVILESVIISLLAMIPGVIIFFVAYEATSLNFIALGITVCIMLTFALLSAWYPAYRTSKINPAIAFNNE